MEKYKKFIPYVVGFIVVAYMVVTGIMSKGESEIDLEIPNIVNNETKIIVEIKGEVRRPGIYKIDANTRLFEVILLAGGLTLVADVESMNLAQVLIDGMSIHIFSKQPVEVPSNKDKISINVASISSLMELKGIGEAKARAIIDYREKNGPFTKIEDVMKVSGISEAMYYQIKDDICL